VEVVISNLVPENISPYEDWFQTGWTESGNAATNIDGVTIKLISPDDHSLDNPSDADMLTYQLIVPQLGTYEVMVSRPYDSVFYIVTSIILSPIHPIKGYLMVYPTDPSVVIPLLSRQTPCTTRKMEKGIGYMTVSYTLPTRQ